MNKDQIKNIVKFIGSKNQNYEYVNGNPIFNDLLEKSKNGYEIYNLFEDIYVLDNHLLYNILITIHPDDRYKIFNELMKSGKINFQINENNLRNILSSLEGESQYKILKWLISHNHVELTIDLLSIIVIFQPMYRKRVLEMLVLDAPTIFGDFQTRHMLILYINFKFIKDIEMTDVFDILFKSDEFVDRIESNEDLMYYMFKITNSVEWLYYRLKKLGYKNIFDNISNDSFRQEYLKNKMVEINRILDKENENSN